MKKEYLVEMFEPVIPNYPKMPVYYFIEAFKDRHLDAIDYQLIISAI